MAQTSLACLPWWHGQFAPLGGSNRLKIKSGCQRSGGNVQCDPEDMRANAEAQMRQLEYWTKGPMPLAVYTLARYVSSEVGSGTPEDKVGVLEAAINRANGTATARGYYANDNVYDGVTKLLLYRQRSGHPNRGWYGPIHGSGGVSTAPYGRWAATSSDPGVDDILLADFVINGGTDRNFANNALDQVGAEWLPKLSQGLPKRAASGQYWVGPVPGIDHWHTFLFFQDKSISPSSPRGQFLIKRGQDALDSGRPDWSQLSICRKLRMPVGAVTAVALLAGLGLAFAAATWIEPAWRGSKYHDLDTDPLLWQRYNRLDPWKR